MNAGFAAIVPKSATKMENIPLELLRSALKPELVSM
jgi:hypothetical protein